MCVQLIYFKIALFTHVPCELSIIKLYKGFSLKTCICLNDYDRLFKGNSLINIQGNSDQNTIVERALEQSITAKFVKLYIVTWYSHISMRWEIYGSVQGMFI